MTKITFVEEKRKIFTGSSPDNLCVDVGDKVSSCEMAFYPAEYNQAKFMFVSLLL